MKAAFAACAIAGAVTLGALWTASAAVEEARRATDNAAQVVQRCERLVAIWQVHVEERLRVLAEADKAARARGRLDAFPALAPEIDR